MKINKYIILCLFAFAMASCASDFEEINTNPNDPIAVPSGLLLTDILASAQNEMNSTFTGGDMGACWAQHIAKVQYNDEARYTPRESIIERVWQTFYEDVICDAAVAHGLAVTEENSNMQAVTLTIQAYGYAVLTDMYGNIPFTQACQASEGNYQPVYDEQEVVYDGIIALLNQANDAYALGEGTINASSDLLYGGDAALWSKFNNALKFRVLMRASGKIDVTAGLNEAMSAGMFTGLGDEAKLQYLDADPNAHPWYETIVFGNRGEWKLNSALVDHMNASNDPRLPIYCALNDAGELRGKPAGIENVPNDDYNYTNVSSLGAFYLEPTLPGFFMSYAEQEFLVAEAIEKNFVTGDAGVRYANGITASCTWNGVDPAPYLAQSGVDYASLGSNKLKAIAEQKWVALFSQGVEAWIEWKRTGYPELTPALNAAASVSGIPVRYTYPAGEQSLNKANLEAANASQGANALDTKFWWLK